MSHWKSKELKAELVEQGRSGLAVGRPVLQGQKVAGQTLDGRAFSLSTTCPPLAGAQLQHGHVAGVTEDRHYVVCGVGDAPVQSRWLVPRVYESAVSADLSQIAFVGTVSNDPGLFAAKLTDARPRLLRRLSENDVRLEVVSNSKWWHSLDWSPDGKYVLYAYGGAVRAIDFESGREGLNLPGGFASWSPSGSDIAYCVGRPSVLLFRVADGTSREIDPGKGIRSPAQWSPDGQYLLVGEVEGSHIPYGAYWIERVSDGAFVQFPGSVRNPPLNWLVVKEEFLPKPGQP